MEASKEGAGTVEGPIVEAFVGCVCVASGNLKRTSLVHSQE
jgi:hypothetical protein